MGRQLPSPDPGRRGAEGGPPGGPRGGPRRRGLWGHPGEDPEGEGSEVSQGRGGGRGLWGDPGEGWRERGPVSRSPAHLSPLVMPRGLPPADVQSQELPQSLCP